MSVIPPTKLLQNTQCDQPSLGASTIVPKLILSALARPVSSLCQTPQTSPSFLLPLQTLFVFQRPEQVLPPAGSLSRPLSSLTLTAHTGYSSSLFTIQIETQLETWSPVIGTLPLPTWAWAQEAPINTCWLFCWWNLPLRDLPHEATLHSWDDM